MGAVHERPGAVGSAEREAGERPGASAELVTIAARSVARMSSENFPVALRVLPRRVRDALTRVYAFARFIDDVGDTAAGDRTALLDEVAADIRAEWAGAGGVLAPVRGLRPLIVTAAMPSRPFLDLVEANRVDQIVGRYESFADLLDYCSLSAAPVGRIVLRLADADRPPLLAWSDEVCAALQVLEHCQDVGEDARAGRVYLPASDLAREGVGAAELTAATTSPALRRVVGQQVDRSRELLRSGPPLVRGLSGWARLAVAGYVAGGAATADALAAARYQVLSAPVTATSRATLAALVRVLATSLVRRAA